MDSKLKTGILGVIFLLFSSLTSLAAWLNYLPYTIIQPDGTSLECFASGDEFHNWIHDKEGFTIIRDDKTGFYTYAILMDDVLQPSEYIAGSDDPSIHGLQPWINISPDAILSKRAQFIKSFMPEKEQIAGYKKPGTVKSEGILNNLVVYIRFNNQEEFQKDTLEYVNKFNQTEDGYNSMINYFMEASFGELSIPSWFYPVSQSETVLSYQDLYDREYFMPKGSNNPDGYQNSEERKAREHKLLKRAVDFISDEVPQSIDLDYNNDGYVDNVVFIVKGGTTAWSTLLWPHRWALYSEQAYINGKRVWDFNFQLETSLNSSGVGVLCHEMYHSLGAPDLYHYESHPITAVGRWDIMEQNANPPQSMGAYMKYRYGGWIENIPEITECGVYQLNPVTHPENNCYKMISPNSATEYFVFEYRKKEGTFESSIPGSGLLIYRINTLKDGEGNAGGPPDEVYIYRPFGTTENNGALDHANFAADHNRIEFNDNSDPACFLSGGSPGGINIKNVGFVGEAISFEVIYDSEPVAEFEISDAVITPGCSVDFSDHSLCGPNTWLWTFEGGTPGTSTEQHPQDIIYNNPGYFDVSLSISNAFGDDIINKSGVVNVSNTILPEVGFVASDTSICTGKPISFTDVSAYCPTSWNWDITPNTIEFIDGTTNSSANPVVLFNQQGFYSVSLTVSNVNGSTTIVHEDYIYVGGNPFPFFEDFETNNLKQSGWTVINPVGSISWEIVKTEEIEDNYAASMNLYYYNKAFARDQLISPAIDLSNTDNAVLSFDHSYSLWKYPQYSDSLIVKITDDCGENWTRLLSLAEDGSGELATHPPFDYNFVPSSPEDWCTTDEQASCYEVDISSWTGNQNVMIMFETVRLVGNNIYLDNISIETPSNVQQTINGQHPFAEVYPNPAKTEIWISTPVVSDIYLYNINGHLILNKEVSSGSSVLDIEHLKNGTYIIKIISNRFSTTSKIAVLK